jgi:acyl carrier protein
MTIAQSEVEQTIRAFLSRANRTAEALGPDVPLYADGIGLDSLETAELSAVLEDSFGADPFSTGDMPQTVGDILSFYDSVANSAAAGA